MRGRRPPGTLLAILASPGGGMSLQDRPPMKHLALLLASACLGGCAAVPSRRPAYEMGSIASLSSPELSSDAQPAPRGEVLAQDSFGAMPPSSSARPEWRIGQPLMQGFLGVSEYSSIRREGGDSPSVDGDDGNLEEMPIIGGGGQWKRGGEHS